MSVVAAKIDKQRNKIYIAADSLVVKGETKKVYSNYSKLSYINNMYIGAVGLAEESSLLFRYAQTHRPETPTEKDVLYFITEFSAWKYKYNGVYGLENHYLIVYEGHLFYIAGMLVIEISDYEAIGCGRDYALAALYLGETPERAVEVACKLNCYVAEPIIKYEVDLAN